jgi:hypothetical protein
MMFSRRSLSFLLVGLFLFACEDKQEAWLREMEGKIECSTVSNPIGAGLPATFTVGGIATPDNVAYT